MTAKVRVFNPPNSLAERLAEPVKVPAIPRSLPEPTTTVSRQFNNPSAAYTRVPMDTNNENGKKGGITFAAQDTLPKLPIPELSSTLDKYLEALRPLQTPRERAETEHAVKDFLATDGPELQEKLKKYAQGKTSYIEQFCMSHFLLC